jgi:hypothetical protein
MNYVNEKSYPKEDGSGFFTIFEGTDVEFIDPIPYFLEWYAKIRLSLFTTDLSNKHPEIPIELVLDKLSDKIQNDLVDEFTKIIDTPVPNNFIKLLTSSSKKEQIHLLKGAKINQFQLEALIIKAWKDYGYSFSNYKAEHRPKGYEDSKLPKLGVLKENSLETIGNTSLSKGQVKQVIEQRSVIISKFIDKASTWHCFFITYNSLKGSENWNNGMPHYHYISDKFGIKRDEVVRTLKSNHYKLGNLPHIELIDKLS